MTLRHIKIFVAVCECGSVTAAAKKLHIAQPAASLAILELEQYYGVKLFDRISKRLHITETGKQFLQYASHIASLFDELEQSIQNWDNIGILRVGASVTIGNYLLPNYVEEFQKSYPEINLQVVVNNSKNIEEYVLRNKIDIGLIVGNGNNSFIESQSFMTDPLVLIISPNHPWTIFVEIDVKALKGEKFILRERGSSSREVFENVVQIQQLKISPAWESTSTQAIIRAVSKGLGVSFLPYLLIKESLKRGEVKCVNIKGVSVERQLSIIYHKNKFLSNSAKNFIDLCLKSSRSEKGHVSFSEKRK